MKFLIHERKYQVISGHVTFNRNGWRYGSKSSFLIRQVYPLRSTPEKPNAFVSQIPVHLNLSQGSETQTFFISEKDKVKVSNVKGRIHKDGA